ncbi:Uncharacterized protein OS=Fimbriimonas ginsengisoli Gsoil 348 GN=OP10G_1685 PE=4 SV=1 [Gemmata massiliana]|uniref:Uncharacterized protein n=1 Tax=Gemmata massiliana TaxID=1210884 RepID=A0A6P2D313_9BACT|nr:hypothetical protein [Gemmata massiliana]VTR94805.1 Uncharacterized protein OS=Fimbriimonas ginsengisoli Gsoil 348 GN=OP10G_1685 PE=4 SV=1 [Gemmata massiliana]
MPIPISCPGCEARIKAPDAAAGKVVRCPKCQGRIAVPATEPAFEVVDEPDDEQDDEPVRPKRSPKSDRPSKKQRPTKSGAPVLLLVGVGVLVLGLGAGAVYWFGIRDNKPVAEVRSASPSPTRSDSAGGAGAAPVATLDPKLEGQLAAYTDVSGYQIRPPVGYTALAAQPPEGMLAGAWTGARRADGTAASLTVMVATPPPGAGDKSVEEFLSTMLRGIEQRRTNWEQSPAEKFTVNGLTMHRVRWSGVDSRIGKAMRGFIYVAKHEGRYIQIASQDVDPGHEADLALTEAAALSFRKK